MEGGQGERGIRNGRRRGTGGYRRNGRERERGGDRRIRNRREKKQFTAGVNNTAMNLPWCVKNMNT